MKNEIIVQKGHYPYNFMLKMAGAKLVYVGEETPENEYPKWPSPEYPWSHKFNNQPEDIEDAINEKTCALYHLFNGNMYEGTTWRAELSGCERGFVPLEEVSKIAKKHNLPLIVDAADQIPPLSNTKKIVEMGGDLVIFSGGKALEGFNDTGLIVGTKDLIEAVSANGIPNHGVGRGFKVSKEQIVAETVAVLRYGNLDIEAELNQERCRCEFILNLVKDMPYVKGVELRFPEIITPAIQHDEYAAIIELDEENLGLTAEEVARKLKNCDPPIWTNNYKFHEGKLWLRAKIWRDYKGIRVFAEKLNEILIKKSDT
jgi:L-seryl-tRNA(Ser) seleniumtransferase